MKPYLQVEELTKSYGDRLLFDSITFGVNEGDKIGVIAKNGTGKSTLLRLLAEIESPDSGKITFRNGLRVGFLEQSPLFTQGDTLMENLLAVIPENDHDEWSHEDKVKQMLSQLGIDDAYQSVAHLSGGQIKRAALARVLLGNPDLLILDEPTNHLDLAVVEWLENYLTRQRVTLLMVTHDRYFLDRVCNKIIEIDQRQIFTYEGNFDYYLRRRAEREKPALLMVLIRENGSAVQQSAKGLLGHILRVGALPQESHCQTVYCCTISIIGIFQLLCGYCLFHCLTSFHL